MTLAHDKPSWVDKLPRLPMYDSVHTTFRMSDFRSRKEAMREFGVDIDNTEPAEHYHVSDGTWFLYSNGVVLRSYLESPCLEDYAGAYAIYRMAS